MVGWVHFSIPHPEVHSTQTWGPIKHGYMFEYTEYILYTVIVAIWPILRLPEHDRGLLMMGQTHLLATTTPCGGTTTSQKTYILRVCQSAMCPRYDSERTSGRVKLKCTHPAISSQHVISAQNPLHHRTRRVRKPPSRHKKRHRDTRRRTFKN